MRSLSSLISRVTGTFQVTDCRGCGQVALVEPPLWLPPCRCLRPRPQLLPRRARPADLALYPLYSHAFDQQESN
ncbi:hypothetical protein ACIOUE_35730 [Streptomyces xanthochromogenes]|uniref:hypothetical protein n=1 Tax=Streptomyces xanthochromogenes TaxID=67384 RepID=UPI0038219E85